MKGGRRQAAEVARLKLAADYRLDMSPCRAKEAGEATLVVWLMTCKIVPG